MGAFRYGAFSLVAGLVLSAAAAPPGRCADPSSDPIISVQADTCFVGRSFGGVTPIKVTIVNRGQASHAVIDVHNRSAYEPGGQFRSEIDVPGGGAKSQVVVYPISRVNHAWSPQPGYDVEVDLPGHSLSAPVVMSDGPEEGQQVALVGDNFGAMTPNRSVVVAADDTHDLLASYVRPENAPTRAIGYAGLKSVVLGDGVERMDAAQWAALRQWVVSGGSLILIAKDYLTVPQVDALLPISPGSPEIADKTHFPLVSDDLTGRKFENIPKPIVGGVLRPGAQPIDSIQAGPNALSFVARRQLGAGTVLYFGVDPTRPDFRNWSGLPKLWKMLIAKASPVAPGTQLTQSAVISAAQGGWGTVSEADRNAANYQAPLRHSDGSDPFEVALPSLPSIVYVFVAYFLLAVPVSFVVLKRMRKMNLAWATGPALAIVFGGVLYMFTSRLNTAPLSRRTAGVLTAVAGDKTANFSGATEIFFPHSGSYDATVKNADSTQSYLVAWPDGYDWRAAQSDIDVVDNGDAIQVPQINVPNLSFRRLYHSQTVAWGGVDSDLTQVSNHAQPITLIGGITNSTGQTLHNAYLALPHGSPDNYGEPVLLKLADVAPGVNSLPGHYSLCTSTTTVSATYPPGSQSAVKDFGPVGWRNVNAPTLFASTSAADFGPALGQYVGGGSTAEVIVSLPALKYEGKN